MDDYRSDPDYHHYMSVAFKVGLYYSKLFFDWNRVHRYYDGPREITRVPPNTPAEEYPLTDDGDNGYDGGDEDNELDDYEGDDYQLGDYYDWPEELYDWEDESTANPWSVGYIDFYQLSLYASGHYFYVHHRY